MRTQDEIAARLKHITDEKLDFLGFRSEVLLPALDFDHARPYLKDEATAEEWAAARGEAGPSDTDDAVKVQMRDYMDFAWGKAADHRGISAGRSVEKITEWVWLLGDDAFYMKVDEYTPYANYGAPILLLVSQEYGFPIPHDPGVMRMARGESCRDGCEDGCGR